jgi:hypothetical protein
MKVVPLFGAGIAGYSYTITRQRRVNTYYDLRKDQDKTKVAVYGTPGCKPLPPMFLTISGSTPVRGIFGTQSQFWQAQDNVITSYNSAGNTQFFGNIGTKSGHVSFNVNQSQMIAVDGAGGYIMNRNTGTFTKISDANFPNGARTVAFLSGFFICEAPNSPSFFVSALNDGLTWTFAGGVPATASAFQEPENLLACDALDGNLILFCQTHGEFWQNTGASPQPFAIIPSATFTYGLAAIFSRQQVGDSIIFLAQDQSGGIHLAQIVGYQVRIISDSDFSYIVGQFPMVSDAVGLTYSANGHAMYQVSFPSASRSFLYDTKTDLMSETQTGLTTAFAQRHTGQYSAYFAGQSIISDYVAPQLYTMDPNTFTDNGVVSPREIETKHISPEFNVFTVDAVYLDMETGSGALNQNPQVMMQVSKDEGHTWGVERWKSLGNQGEYLTRMQWDRWGSSSNAKRSMVFRIRMTDPAKFIIAEGAMELRMVQNK